MGRDCLRNDTSKCVKYDLLALPNTDSTGPLMFLFHWSSSNVQRISNGASPDARKDRCNKTPLTRRGIHESMRASHAFEAVAPVDRLPAYVSRQFDHDCSHRSLFQSQKPYENLMHLSVLFLSVHVRFKKLIVRTKVLGSASSKLRNTNCECL